MFWRIDCKWEKIKLNNEIKWRKRYYIALRHYDEHAHHRKECGIRISIIADRILPLNNTPHKYVNHFEVYGTVKSIVNFGDMHKVNINVVSNGYISTVPITFNYNDYRLNSEIGEPIRVSGIISTTGKEVNGKMRYYQNYVANGVL